MKELTDAELVCEFMETRPLKRAIQHTAWWWCDWNSDLGSWYPLSFTLDALHLVEEKLTEKQWSQYSTILTLDKTLGNRSWGALTDSFRLLHASAETKLKALATVLRGAGAAH